MNLLNELGKRDKMRGLPSILSLFCTDFNTEARMLDSIYLEWLYFQCPNETCVTGGPGRIIPSKSMCVTGKCYFAIIVLVREPSMDIQYFSKVINMFVFLLV